MLHRSLTKRQTDITTLQSDHDWKKNRRYGIVIDAGSSGSRVYVYSWKDHEHVKSITPPEQLRGKIPIVERGDQHGLKWTHRQEPGISTFGSKPSEIGEHLRTLLNFAKEVVPEENYTTTPVFLMATAGMRLLPESEQATVLDATCAYIRDNYPFFMSDCNTHIKIIPGELEGVYGWVATNYLMGGFDLSIQNYIDNDEGQRETHHTFGFLDMGGASTQIAFEPEHHQKEEHKSHLAKIHLRTLDGRSVDYDVFVTTFLGYGSNEARRRYLEERVKQMYAQESGKNVLDEHHSLHLDEPCLPVNLNITDAHSTSVPLTLHGTGNFTQCLEATSPLLNKDAECKTEPCLFNGVHTPHIDWSVNKFVGISEYWYSSHDILGLGGVYDFKEYETKASEYCAKDWTVLMSEHKDLSVVEVQRYQLQCFKSAWIVNVLHNGIEVPRIVDPGGHLSDDAKLLEQSIESVQSKNWTTPFQSIDTINDIQVSWTLGHMVLHVTNQIPLLDYPNQLSGHSTDDEGPHQIVDGVELPEPGDHDHSRPIAEISPSSKPGLLDSLWMDTSVFSIGIMLVMIACIGFIWYLYNNSRRKRRFDGDYRRLDGGSNGGLLGVSTGTTGQSTLGSVKNALSSTISRSAVLLRYWTSRLLRGRGMYVNANNGPSDPPIVTEPINLNDSVSINMNMNTPNDNTNGSRTTLGPSKKSHSFVSRKYWSKKRYSGDSHNIGMLIANGKPGSYHGSEGSGTLPFRSSSSAFGLANRSSSTSNLTARTGSSPNLHGLSTMSIERAPSPLAGEAMGASASRPTSRIGFAIHELSDEDEYALSDGPLSTRQHREAPGTTAASTHAWLPSDSSPRGSPRASLDDRRKPIEKNT
ncbi:nucleoside phosphatase family-domain-containing protein [Radiomyces spectabilis]|uniref:nucleoside phosphatase family-domain-containing protein n=1 Tax=Radiomyces spectabilis TaxID=64574 RepID=UPI00222105AA|nr:nucleoside phosphatase family-domain-containing protein [Radiomyces spectabilis]KAI8384332.1 nucleoside phosphatase family-domain-containing protein [Radiomyces spectabilis]